MHLLNGSSRYSRFVVNVLCTQQHRFYALQFNLTQNQYDDLMPLKLYLFCMFSFVTNAVWIFFKSIQMQIELSLSDVMNTNKWCFQLVLIYFSWIYKICSSIRLVYFFFLSLPCKVRIHLHRINYKTTINCRKIVHSQILFRMMQSNRPKYKSNQWMLFLRTDTGFNQIQFDLFRINKSQNVILVNTPNTLCQIHTQLLCRFSTRHFHDNISMNTCSQIFISFQISKTANNKLFYSHFHINRSNRIELL